MIITSRGAVRSAAVSSVAFLLVASATIDAQEKKSRPNFVVIFIDDMGYGDIAPFGSTINQTPHLDRMAAEGMKLTSFYVAAPVCTPSRAALMTGCYPRRVGLGKGSGHVVLFPGDKHGLHPDELTVAELLKAAGYATACFGKWHLGDQPEFLPTAQGFDEYFGIPYSNDMWPGLKRWPFPALPILRQDKVVDQVDDLEDQATLCRRFTEEAVQFIRRKKSQPFFLYLPHAFVHHPRAASPGFVAEAKTVTEAQIEEVDWSVGQVLQALRDEGLASKTLVLFTSDNGGARGCVNKPLRGGKGSAWEGGLREPTLAWWPKTIPAGSVCDEVATAMDLLPTFVRLAGGKVPVDRVIDGKDILALLSGTPGAKTPHDRFFYHQGDTLRAVRSGPWKLFRRGQLFHLLRDIGESTNVAAKHPEVVQRLTGYLDAFDAEIRKGARPVGVSHSPRTLLPRPGVKGEEAFAPTLSLKKK
jgi:arylsulfatase A-like enzyme